VELNLDVKFIMYCVMSGFRREVVRWDLRSAGLLRSLYRQLITDVSEQPSDPMFKGLLKMGPSDCPETSANNYQYTLSHFLEERRS